MPASSPDSAVGRPGLRVGLNLGLTQLYGDLSSPTIGFGAGLNVSYPLGSVLAVTLLGDFGSLGAQQIEKYNSVATANYTQAAIGGTVNLSRLFSSKQNQLSTLSNRKAKGNLDFYIGMGLIAFDASASSITTGKLQRYTNGSGSHHTGSDNITAKGAAGTASTREFAVPLGLRYNRSLSPSWAIYADLRYNFVATDKLDASVENDYSTIDTPNGGGIFGKAVLNTSRDKWASLSVGLAYQFKRALRSASRIRHIAF